MTVEDTAWYQAALALVRRRHGAATDALGHPYNLHFERVAQRLLRLFPQATRGQVEAALLHDALEPGPAMVADLDRRGLDEEALRIIRLITLPTDGRSYLDYVAGLVASGDVHAIEVKLADNLDATEFYSTRRTPEARALMEGQYDPSRRMMQDALIRSTAG